MTVTSVRAEVPRDDFERPLIIPPGGGKPKPYRRCTKYIDVLEDTYKLNRWRQRNVVLGLTERPDLLLSAAAHRGDKDKLDEIVDDATEAAKAHAAANIGTAVHALAEQHDRGQTVGTVPGDYRRDLNAYIRETTGMEHVHVEQFMVNDELKVGGTPDRISVYTGVPRIVDIKTGNSDDDGNLSRYGQLKIAMQLAVYAHSDMYDPATGTRTPVEVDQDQAIMIHLPAGFGRCGLFFVDIATGWEAVQDATRVWGWRKRQTLATPINVDAAVSNLEAGGLIQGFTEMDTKILNAIAYANTADQLTTLWLTYQHQWNDALTAAAVARKAQLEPKPA